MPARSGVAFVVITHHHRRAPNLLPRILRPHARMPVVDARDGMAIQVDRVHVIPPGVGAIVRDGALVLDGERIAGRLVRPIDVLFRSLAHECQEQAIGIILSGTGSDGSAGAAEIRRLGGFTLAQDAAAAYRDMPENAIALGAIDRVLPVESCPQAILSRLAEKRGVPLEGPAGAVGDDAAAIAAIAAEVQRVTGHDLSSYKDEVVRRRVAHRMILRGCGSLADYARALLDEADEVHRL